MINIQILVLTVFSMNFPPSFHFRFYPCRWARFFALELLIFQRWTSKKFQKACFDFLPYFQSIIMLCLILESHVFFSSTPEGPVCSGRSLLGSNDHSSSLQFHRNMFAQSSVWGGEVHKYKGTFGTRIDFICVSHENGVCKIEGASPCGTGGGGRVQDLIGMHNWNACLGGPGPFVITLGRFSLLQCRKQEC